MGLQDISRVTGWLKYDILIPLYPIAGCSMHISFNNYSTCNIEGNYLSRINANQYIITEYVLSNYKNPNN